LSSSCFVGCKLFVLSLLFHYLHIVSTASYKT
jgi:hypothetical protein